jgi:hypothetical protein
MPDKFVGQAPVIIPMTPKAIKYHNDIFASISKEVEKISSTPISVFVCGPSNGVQPLVQKKVDIINDLRKQDVTAIVGEEEVSQLKLKDREKGKPIQPDNAYELAIAQRVDLIVIIRASPGSIAEAHEFLSNYEIAYKICICVDKAHAGGYSDSGAISLHRTIYRVIDYVYPDDIENCTLKSSVMKWVQDHRTAKGLHQRGFK